MLLAVLLTACHARTQAAPTSITEAPVEARGCGPEFPAAIDVFETIGAPVDHAAPGTPPPHGQVVRTWRTPDFVLEARWPADPREVQAPAGAQEDAGLLAGWSSTGSSDLTVDVSTPADVIGDMTVSVMDFTVDFSSGTRPLATNGACGPLQLRISASNGQRQTVGVVLGPLGSGARIVDLGALVDSRTTSDEPLAAGRTSLCRDASSVVTEVHGAPSMASPVEALRSFLQSGWAATLPTPSLPRPFDEITLTSDGSVRYEHYVEWNTFVVIMATSSDGAWAVTGWWSDSC